MVYRNAARSLALLAFFFASSVSNALPITVEVLNNASQFSLVHDIPNPLIQDDYLFFDPGQTLDLDLTGGILTSLASQTFSLTSNNGATASFELVSLSMDLNDTDGFLNGTMNYALDGTAGVFTFTNSNFGASAFNSSSFDGSLFELFVWGGDSANGLGIDFGISGTVPEPPVLLLVAFGLLALRAFARRA